jgi:REP element-mobilizing transposase RayT
MRASVRGLRREALFRRIVGAVAASVRARAASFRVLHFSVQDDHLHLLVEATDARALTAGARGLAVRVSRGVNRALSRRGRLWADRYHARELTSPRAFRNALVYVLANHRKHAASVAAIDPCSSAAWFSGWKDEPRTSFAFDDVRRRRDAPPPIAPPKTWLASVGWRRHGLVAVDESPARRRARDHA